MSHKLEKRKSYQKRAPTPEEKRVHWLLDFMQRDLGVLRAGERLDLIEDCASLLEMRDRERVSVSAPDAYGLALTQRGATWPGGAVAAVQAKLNAGVALLEAGRSWTPHADSALVPTFRADADKNVARSYSGSHEAVMLASAVDLLTAHWARIRRCDLKSCNRLFLVDDGRQRFHDPRCAKAARAENLKPRDYVQEVANAARRDQLKRKQHTPRRVSAKKGAIA